MAAFLIVVFVFIIIALGMAKLTGPFTRKSVVKPKGDKLPSNPELRALVKALSNEGYYGRTRVADEDITYVEHAVLSGMIQYLARKHDLRWKLPDYRLRIRVVGPSMPEWVRESYSHVLMTPTHAIGFNPKGVDEDLVYS